MVQMRIGNVNLISKRLCVAGHKHIFKRVCVMLIAGHGNIFKRRRVSNGRTRADTVCCVLVCDIYLILYCYSSVKFNLNI